jgi:hypothetical protein
VSFDRNAASWTSQQLLADVRRKARLPLNHPDYTDANLLRDASECIWSFAGWALSLSGEGRLSFSLDRATLSAISSPYRAASEFFLPPLAVGDTIQNVLWVSQDGACSEPLTLITIGAEHEYDTPTSKGTPSVYTLLDGRIRVYPQPSEAGLVRFNYQRRSGELILDTAATVPSVASVTDAGNGYCAFALATGSGTALAVGDYVDLVNNQYPYRILYSDLYVGATSASTATLFVPYEYVQDVPVDGMRLVRAGQTPYVSLPLELRLAVTLKTCAHVLLGVGDRSLAGDYNALAEDEMKKQLGILNPRTKQSREKVVNRHSLLRRMLRGQRAR